MKKLFIFAPDNDSVIEAIVNEAVQKGAGIMGNYTHCYFVTKGTGNWKAHAGAHPAIGKVGEYSHIPEVRIEMICPDDAVTSVISAIKSEHPYEEPEIDVITIDADK